MFVFGISFIIQIVVSLPGRRLKGRHGEELTHCKASLINWTNSEKEVDILLPFSYSEVFREHVQVIP